jgi:carbon monoxide dehydrogenase subunit G
MPSFADEQWVRRPPADVFAFMTDLATSPRWIKGLTEARLTHGPMRQGARFQATRKVGGRSTTETIEVVRHDPPRGYSVVAGLMGGGVELRIDYDLAPEKDGTRVRSVTTATARSLGGRLVMPMFWGAVKKNDAGNLALLKRALEGPA